ncbi:MAG: tetratricopeptide repeat protein [Pseudomonadota bacterium]
MGLQIDQSRREAAIDGSVLDLEPKLFDLLQRLVAANGELVSKDQLLAAVWEGRIVSDAAISQAVAKLRRAIRAAGVTEDPIKTVHGHGYRWAGADLLKPSIDESPAAPTAPSPGNTTTRSSARWRWAVLAVLALAALVLGLRPEQAAAPATLAVAPLAVAADSDIDWAELGLASMLGDAVKDRTSLQVMSAARVRSALRRRGITRADPAARQLAALADVAGVDHLLLASVSRGSGGYEIRYELASPSNPVQSGTLAADSIEMLASGLSEAVASELDVAYAAGIALKKISADEFVNEAFARGMQSLLSGDAEQARAFFDSALASDPKMAWARYELGNALNQLSRFDQAVGAFNEARAQALTSGDINLAGAAATGLGMVAWRNGDLVLAEQHLNDARQRFQAVGNDANLASALGNLGILAENQGRRDDAKTLYGQTLSLYRQAGKKLGESAVYSNLAALERKQGRYVEAETLQRRAAEIQEQVGLRQMLVFSYSELGTVIFAQGRWEEGAEFLERAVALGQELGDRLGAADALSARAEQLILQGRLAEAKRRLEEALAVQRELNNPAGEGTTRLLLGQIASCQRDEGESFRQADLAVSLFEALGNPLLRARALIARAGSGAGAQTDNDLAAALILAQDTADSSLLASVLKARGERQKDPQLLREALDHAQAAGDQRLRALLAIELALILLDADDADGRELDALLGIAQRWQPAYSGSLFLEARLLRRSGEPQAALAQLVKARDAAGECWQPRQQAQLDELAAGGIN